eukprot:TRINITY_DN1453_c0_g1_i2.p1 TRINITY_DN1453_c0_g1~~TRINITY_DN1453_c0_g1_i2.p1  ORF type:complete len:529 (-),score=124.62 TRINITY_DN1453_c0_g1_i2:208-1794(-)
MTHSWQPQAGANSRDWAYSAETKQVGQVPSWPSPYVYMADRHEVPLAPGRIASLMGSEKRWSDMTLDCGKNALEYPTFYSDDEEALTPRQRQEAAWDDVPLEQNDNAAVDCEDAASTPRQRSKADAIFCATTTTKADDVDNDSLTTAGSMRGGKPFSGAALAAPSSPAMSALQRGRLAFASTQRGLPSLARGWRTPDPSPSREAAGLPGYAMELVYLEDKDNEIAPLADQEDAAIPKLSALRSLPTAFQQNMQPANEEDASVPKLSALRSMPMPFPQNMQPENEEDAAIPKLSALRCMPTTFQQNMQPEHEENAGIPKLSSLGAMPAIFQPNMQPEQEDDAAIPKLSTLGATPAIFQQSMQPDKQDHAGIPKLSPLGAMPAIFQPNVQPDPEDMPPASFPAQGMMMSRLSPQAAAFDFDAEDMDADDFQDSACGFTNADVLISIGTHGHPDCCGQACKYAHSATGCAMGADCSRCHICMPKATRRRHLGRKERMRRRAKQERAAEEERQQHMQQGVAVEPPAVYREMW